MFSLCNITYAYICLELLKMFSVFQLTIPPFGKFTRNYCFSPSYANPKLFPGPSRSRLGDLPWFQVLSEILRSSHRCHCAMGLLVSSHVVFVV